MGGKHSSVHLKNLVECINKEKVQLVLVSSLLSRETVSSLLADKSLPFWSSHCSHLSSGPNLSIHNITTWHTHCLQMSFKSVKFFENPHVAGVVLKTESNIVWSSLRKGLLFNQSTCAIFFHPACLKSSWPPASSQVTSFSQCTDQSISSVKPACQECTPFHTESASSKLWNVIRALSTSAHCVYMMWSF